MSTPKRSAYDTVVVGAGVIGLSCAWRLAQRGLSVLVVERDRPGAGASGVAAGMLAAATEADFGEEQLLALNLESARMWPAFAAELEDRSGAPSGYEPSGALVVAADRDDAEELRRLHAFQRSLGLDAEWVGARECRRLEPGLSPRVAGAVVAPGDHQADPRRLVAALVAALAEAGGELVCGTGVEAIDGGGAVVAGGTRIAAGEVVVAAGPWSPAIPGAPAAPEVRPVKGQILRLSAPRPVAGRLIRTPRCYIVPRRGGEVVVGATQEERGFDTTVTADGVFRLLEAAAEVLPDIGELEFVEAAARLRPAAPDNAPLIGRAGYGRVVWATGHHRNGVLLAPVTAAAVADIVCGGEAPATVRAFSPRRFATRAAA